MTAGLPGGGLEIAALARELGFARAAIVPIEPPRRHALYESWLAAGRAGEMAYLASPEHRSARADLRALLGTATALIVVALAHDRLDPVPPEHTLAARHPLPAGRLLRGKIARYARGGRRQNPGGLLQAKLPRQFTRGRI